MVENFMTEQILQAAYKLFTSQGIQPFTMDEIAARLAISKKTLYRFFDSRQQLVQQVCERVADNYEAGMAKADTADADNLQRALGYLMANVQFCKKTSPAFFTDLQKHDPIEYANLVNTLNNIIQHRLLKVMEQGIVEGVFRGSLHPPLIIALLQQHIQKDFEFAAEWVTDYSKDEVFRQAMYLFLYGIIAPEAIPRLENELQQYSFVTTERIHSIINK
jgi:TetR/AcrR family transcriptional regulator, cholesterol catabolism regulator